MDPLITTLTLYIALLELNQTNLEKRILQLEETIGVPRYPEKEKEKP